MLFSRQTTERKILSSQARLLASLPQYLSHFAGPRRRLALHLLFSAMILCLSYRWHLLAFLALLPLIPDMLHLVRVRRHFWLGEVNAAKVIGLDPVFIACYADLGRGLDGSYPAIRIVQLPESVRDRLHLRTGDNLSAVCVHIGSDGNYRSDGFTPMPSICGTNKAAELERLEHLVPDWQWEAIDEGLFQIPQPFRPGTYLIDLSTWEPLAQIQPSADSY